MDNVNLQLKSQVKLVNNGKTIGVTIFESINDCDFIKVLTNEIKDGASVIYFWVKTKYPNYQIIKQEIQQLPLNGSLVSCHGFLLKGQNNERKLIVDLSSFVQQDNLSQYSTFVQNLQKPHNNSTQPGTNAPVKKTQPKRKRSVRYAIGSFFVKIGNIPIIGGILKLLLRGIMRTILILVVVLTIWLIICVIKHNGFTAGWIAFIDSGLWLIILGWYYASFTQFKRGDIHGILFGSLMFFAPLIIIYILGSSGSKNEEWHDGKGNTMTITRK